MSQNNYRQFVTALEAVRGEVIVGPMFDELTITAKHAGDLASGLKKLLFYRGLHEPEGDRVVAMNSRLLHVVLGKLDEVCEMFDRVRQDIGAGGEDEKVPDRANWLEELGDDGFYTEMALDVLDLTAEQVKDANESKLRIRYPEGFNVAASNNRDRAAERKSLEASLT